jgi:hypothetical protein
VSSLADGVAEFLKWRKDNHLIAYNLTDDDLEVLFPILESYAEWRITRQDVAARSTAKRAFTRVVELERVVKGYRETDLVNTQVAQLTKWRTWRWWMLAQVWWRATKARWQTPIVHAQVLIGLLRRDYASGRRLEWIGKWQSLSMRSVRRYGCWRIRWEVWTRCLPIERKWEPFERLRARMLRKAIGVALSEEEESSGEHSDWSKSQ